MTIREKVAQEVDAETFDRFDTSTLVDLVISAFLKAAAEEGWHIRPDEANSTMQKAGKPYPHWPFQGYRAMLAAAPKFEWDK